MLMIKVPRAYYVLYTFLFYTLADNIFIYGVYVIHVYVYAMQNMYILLNCVHESIIASPKKMTAAAASAAGHLKPEPESDFFFANGGCCSTDT